METLTTFLRKKISILVLGHLIIFSLLWGLFPNPNTSFFAPVDRAIFTFLNGLIENNFYLQNFFAIANHKMADWVEDGIFFLFFVWILAKTKKEERARKIAESIFVILGAGLIIFLSKAVIFQSLIHIKRASPSLVISSFTYLPEKVSWLKIKTGSAKSFPGDHGTTALLSIIGFLYVGRGVRSVQIAATLYGIFLTLPRMTVGAHWFSDIYIGSASTVAIFSLWAFCTPFASFSISLFEKIIKLCTKKTVKAHG